MEVNLMNISEILFEVLWVIFCSLCLILFVISRKMIKREKLLLESLGDEEIESISEKNNNSKYFSMGSLVLLILCCIYLLISIVNKGLLIDFFGEKLNKVINSIIIVIILLPYLTKHIKVIRRYNKVKKLVEKK